MVMGVFLAWWWRKDILAPAALAFALGLPILAHGFYDFPLMALDVLWELDLPDPQAARKMLFGLYIATILVSAAAAIWAGRMEMVEVFLHTQPDIDLYPPDMNRMRVWHWIGRCLILGACVIVLIGASNDDLGEGAWLMATAVFPAAFGIVMARKVPDEAYISSVNWPRVPSR
jgi:hypothetical protein